MEQPTTEELLEDSLEVYYQHQSFTEVRKMLEQKGLNEHRINHLIRQLDDILIEEEIVKVQKKNVVSKMIAGILIIIFGMVVVFYTLSFDEDLGIYYYLLYLPLVIGAYVAFKAWREYKQNAFDREESGLKFEYRITHRRSGDRT
ncbi:MAG: hypothetical protein JJU28_14670 [Cyclobacteriaceae bacterium]|nr:hypothetical protein [Cyclobacteriaceae bacterium]